MEQNVHISNSTDDQITMNYGSILNFIDVLEIIKLLTCLGFVKHSQLSNPWNWNP